MISYLDYPLNPQRALCVDVDGDVVRSIHIVPTSEVVTSLEAYKAASAPLLATRRFFDTYFGASPTSFALEEATRRLLPYLEPGKTVFVRKVRQSLIHDVSLGDTVTYADLASMLGNPRAARAVGQCLAKNPYHIVIPCHRIVSKDPEQFYYAAGSDVKRELLKYEASCIHAPMTAQIPF